ncbi:hypothetical protein Tco_0422305 [Tanacetum coccineum]
MPPRRLKKKYIKRLVEKRVAKAIEEYEKSRANLDSAGSLGGNPGNAEGTMNVHVTLMCPELVPTEKKKIEKYVRGFPERIKGNITSSKPATLHECHQTWPGETVGDALQSVRSAKELVIRRKIVELTYFQGARARAYVVVENLQQNPNVVTDDLSGLPPVREIEFRIDHDPGRKPLLIAIPISFVRDARVVESTKNASRKRASFDLVRVVSSQIDHSPRDIINLRATEK